MLPLDKPQDELTTAVVNVGATVVVIVVVAEDVHVLASVTVTL